MKKLAIILGIAILAGCDCITQIPTQIYLANDSCEFYLPDYSQAIQVRDNCCVDTATAFWQVPNSGFLLHAGEEVQVTVYGRDCSGNQISMSFLVMVVDRVPPTFYYDSTDFISLGQYQNETRTWYFWTDAEPNIQPSDPPVYYSQQKTPRDHTTDIGPNLHDAYYESDEYYKMSLFTATSTYRIMDMYMAIAKIGNPEGKFHVEVWQLNISDTSLYYPVCGAVLDLSEIHSRVSTNPYDLPAEELIWQTINLSDGVIVRGGWYAIRTYCEGNLNEENKVIWNTTDFPTKDQYQFLMYSYDSGENYGINQAANYMYQIWGIDI